MKVRSGDTEIFYRVLGDGKPVVLLHPFPTSSEFWLPAAELLATRYQVVLPDLRGHGESGIGEGPATMQKHAADIARVCDELKIGRAAFGGISIGGYVLFEFWRRFRERISAIMLIDTRAQADNDEARANRLKSAAEVLERGTEELIDALIPKFMGATTVRNRPDLVASAKRMMMKMPAAAMAAVQRGMAARPDSVLTLASINVPALVVVGDEDTLTPPSDAQLMHREIAGSKLQAIPNAGHYAVFERHEEASRLIRQFLDSLPASAWS
jgi:3-oxoadipate enol-lactonase